MASKDRNSTRSLAGPLAGMAVALFGLGMMLDLVHRLARSRPTVGDMIVFTPRPPGRMDSKVEVTARLTDGSECKLEIAAIRESGGSLVVEERRPGPPELFRAHWSGMRTAAGPANCGTRADLWLRIEDLANMAQAAGGWGVGTRRTVMLPPWWRSNSNQN
ncbi:MAG: hypothetical protein AB7F35_03150 [Acetobacteraceae bacterium]